MDRVRTNILNSTIENIGERFELTISKLQFQYPSLTELWKIEAVEVCVYIREIRGIVSSEI